MLKITGTAVLIVNEVTHGKVQIRAMTRNSNVPSLLELSGDAKLLQAAYNHTTVRLKFSGLDLRTRVLGQRKDAALHVAAKPLYRSLAAFGRKAP